MTMLQFWVPISESGLNFLTVSPFVTYQEVCVRGGGGLKSEEVQVFFDKAFYSTKHSFEKLQQKLENVWEKKLLRKGETKKDDSTFEDW